MLRIWGSWCDTPTGTVHPFHVTAGDRAALAADEMLNGHERPYPRYPGRHHYPERGQRKRQQQ
jgi:hypothetical protein